MAVASIAHYDWPEDWPDLLPFLMKLINDRMNMHGGKYGTGESFLGVTLYIIGEHAGLWVVIY